MPNLTTEDGLAHKQISILKSSQGRHSYKSTFLIALGVFFLANLLAALFLTAHLIQPKAKLASLKYESGNLGKIGSWWLAKSFVEQPTAPDIIIFGNSQMGGVQGADSYVFAKSIDFTGNHRSATIEQQLLRLFGYPLRVFMCALPGAMISDHLITSQVLLSSGHKPRLVIIGLSPRDFIDSDCPLASATESFHFFSQFLDLKDDLDLFFTDPLNKWQWLFVQNMPLRSCLGAEFRDPSSGIRTNDNSKHLGKLLLSGGLPFAPIKPGECVISTGTGYFYVDNTNEYKRRYAHLSKSQFQQQLRCLVALLQNLKHAGIKVIAVNMPLTQSNRKLLPDGFWSFFRKEICETCHNNGASWADLCDCKTFTKDDFVDTVHLNSRGGYKLCHIFAKCIYDEMPRHNSDGTMKAKDE